MHPMHPIEHIRRNILKLKQDEFAEIAGTSQGTVSRWETGGLEPDRSQMDRIRSEVFRRGLPWDDGWFFQAPADDRAGAAA